MVTTGAAVAAGERRALPAAAKAEAVLAEPTREPRRPRGAGGQGGEVRPGSVCVR